MFRTVLVANRGEIALRVIRTLREMSVRSVAVYSDADAASLHVEAADAAVRIGPARARESYLDAERIVAAALESGAEAVHPGYGFLSESAAFARRCAEAGLVYVGPSPQALEAAGEKARARATAAAAGVPTVPGAGPSADLEELTRLASELHTPLLVKAAAGGGGKGMRRVEDASELREALSAAARETRAAFGDGTLLLERYVHPARHVEVQIIGDGRGGIAVLGERECSLQRRYQKIVEEAPSPGIDVELRERLLEYARRVAAAVDYVGAGTVEFLVGPGGDVYFLEVNARLQVEHPVTELVTGLDLVRLQLEVAAGEAPSAAEIEAAALPARGHSIEARLYAEDPATGFLPSSGTIGRLAWPAGAGVRVDSALREGQVVGTDYDPLLAKVIAGGPDREQARLRLVRALEETILLGFPTNQGFLLDVLMSPAFRAASTFTHTVEGNGREPGLATTLVAEAEHDGVPGEVLAAAAVSLAGVAGASAGVPSTAAAADGADRRRSPWHSLGRWRAGEA